MRRKSRDFKGLAEWEKTATTDSWDTVEVFFK